MIASFRDKETERLWQSGKNRHLPVDLERRAFKKLAMLNAAVALDNLKVPPGNQLESLRGERAGQHSINFPGIYEVVRGDRAIPADTAIRLGRYFALPAQFWLNLQNDYDLRIAEGSGIGKGIKPRKTTIDTEPAEARV